jgi:hypothetical protein
MNSMVNNAGLGSIAGSPRIHELGEKDWVRTMYAHYQRSYGQPS